MNRAFLVGNLTRDPENSVVSGDISNCRFSIAVSRRVSKNKEVDYFNIVAWRGLADTCGKYLKKGSKVAVIGEIQNRSYETKDGQKRYVTEIMADEVQFLSSKGDAEVIQNDDVEEEVQDLKPIPDDGDIPF